LFYNNKIIYGGFLEACPLAKKYFALDFWEGQLNCGDSGGKE